MSPSRRLDRATLDSLLEGVSSRPDDLVALLSAARAGATADELVGLQAALAAFADPATSRHPVAAALPATPQPRGARSRLSSFGSRAAVAAVAGAALLGGVALAATTDGAPQLLPASTHAASAAAEHVPTAAPRSTAAVDTGGADDGTAGAGRSDAGDTSTGAPTPSLAGLCNAWLARPHAHGRADESAAAAVLVAAAGGADRVSGYCTSLLATAHPHPSHPHPGKPGATHVPGKPASLPPGAGHGNRSDAFPLPPINRYRPTSLPSAVPTDLPGR